MCCDSLYVNCCVVVSLCVEDECLRSTVICHHTPIKLWHFEA